MKRALRIAVNFTTALPLPKILSAISTAFYIVLPSRYSSYKDNVTCICLKNLVILLL